MFSFLYLLDAYDLEGVRLPHHYLPPDSHSWCRVTLVFAIRRQISILDFKRLATYIIFLDTTAPALAEKFVNANLVQNGFDC